MKVTAIIFLIIFSLIPVYGQDETQLKEVVLNTSWYPQAQFAGYFVAAKKGFYEKRGIKVRFIFSNYDFGVKKNLAEGKAEFGIMWLHEGVIAYNENNNLTNIAQFFDSSNILIVSRSKQITSIGIWKPYVKFLQTYIHESLSKKIEIVPLRNGNEAFILGAVDAITVMNYNEYNQLISSGIDQKDLYVRRLSDMGLVLPEDGIYCSKDYYRNNKKLCDDFVEASMEGWNYAFNHIDESVNICFDYMETSNYYSNYFLQKLMLNSIKNVAANITKRNGSKLKKESFDKVVRFLIEKKLVSSEIKYEHFCEGNLQ